MGVRKATIVFADIIGSSEVSNNYSIEDYDRFIGEFHEGCVKARDILFPRDAYTVEEMEATIQGDEICLILHSGGDIDLSTVDADKKAEASYLRDARNAILFALGLKLLWLISPYNRKRISQSLLPRDLGIGINFGPVVFSTHPATGRDKSSEGYSINLGKRIEGKSREGERSKIFVSKEIKFLAEKGGVEVEFDEGRSYGLKGITTPPYLHEIKEIKNSRFVLDSPLMQELAKVSPDNIEKYYSTALINDQEFWLRKLVAYLLLASQDERALNLLETKDYVRYNFEQGNAYHFLGKYENALKSYEAILKVDPSISAVWNNKGSTLAKLTKFKEALECFDKTLKLKPEYPEALSNKGVALRYLGKPKEALECFDKALKLKPEDAEILSNKGGALVDLEKPKEALEYYDKALELRESLPDKGKRIYPRWTVLIYKFGLESFKFNDLESAELLARKFRERYEDSKKDRMNKIIDEVRGKFKEELPPEERKIFAKIEKMFHGS